MTYDDEVNAAVLGLADTVAGLDELARRLRAVYPPLIVAAVARLRADDAINADCARRLQRYIPQRPATRHPQLPVPHPLDADWRLGRFSQEAMAERLRTASTSGALLLGAPTVHLQIAKGVKSTLVDANPALSHDLPSEVIFGDIGTADPLLPLATAAFADPPWYLSETFQFLWYAAASVALGAPIYLSVPGQLTRPGIGDERDQLVEVARTFGLEAYNLEQGVLGYDSPPFEVASLAAAGLPGFPSDWRYGDLMTFRKVADNLASRPAFPDRPIWIERIMFGVRIRFKMRTSVKVAFDPMPRDLQADGAVRRTVSARDSLLQRVDVWTSGNQIFACADTDSLLVIADAIAADLEPLTMVQDHLGRMVTLHERQSVDNARRRLLDILNADLTLTH